MTDALVVDKVQAVAMSGDVRHAFICPKCAGPSGVKDSRPAFDGRAIRRRRACLVTGCSHRWTTYELELPDDFNLDEIVAGARKLQTVRDIFDRLHAGLDAFQRELFP
jgi:hypothetical protein